MKWYCFGMNDNEVMFRTWEAAKDFKRNISLPILTSALETHGIDDVCADLQERFLAFHECSGKLETESLMPHYRRAISGNFFHTLERVYLYEDRYRQLLTPYAHDQSDHKKLELILRICSYGRGRCCALIRHLRAHSPDLAA